MHCMVAFLVSVVLALPALADDWTGKTIRVKEDKLKLGRKFGGGLVQDGAALDKAKTYPVKADDGTYLEVDGGFVFRTDVDVAADTKPFPKPLKDGEKVKQDGLFEKYVVPKRQPSELRMGGWKDGKEETWTPKNFFGASVLEDRDGFLRVNDGQREGWVSKDDMVTRKDALDYFDKAVKANAKDDYALCMRGWARFWDGKYDKAMDDYTEAIRLKPNTSEYHIGRGDVWRYKSDYDKAILDYTEAIRLDPSNWGALHSRGDLLIEKKEYEKASADFTELIRLKPKEAYYYKRRGLTSSCLNDHEKAIKDLTEVIRLDPWDQHALYNRGPLWIKRKQYDKAIADFTEALRMDPANYIAHEGRAEAYAKLKKYDDAVKGFEKAMELNKAGGNQLAYAKFRASCPDAKYRDGKKAVELAKKAIEKKGNDAGWEFADAMAMAHAEAGDFEPAVVEQRKAVDMLKADKLADKDDLKQAEARLELYKAKKPYRDELSERKVINER